MAPLPDPLVITFILGVVGTSPSVFDETDIVSVSFTYGELNLDETDLASFDFDLGLASAATLFYSFNPVDTASSTGIITMNSSFELSVTGTDRDSDLSFTYLLPQRDFHLRGGAGAGLGGAVHGGTARPAHIHAPAAAGTGGV